MSGWGKLVYEHPFQVYFSEHGSNVYDYFMDPLGSLILTEYNYRRDDLTILDAIDPRQTTVEVEWVGTDGIRLRQGNAAVELQRIAD